MVVERMISQQEHGKILNAVKRCFSRSAHRRAVLLAATSKQKGPRGGRMYICAECKKSFSGKDVQVDHIKPVIPVNKAALGMKWDTIVNRIYCDKKNLQVLCRECHKQKSKEEMAARAKHRKARKS